jgi:hypothetical protein
MICPKDAYGNDIVMPCKYKQGPTTQKKYVCMKMFYPACPKVSQFCNPLAGAFLASCTICAQRIWSW